MRREKFLQVPGALNHRRRRTAVDHVHGIALGLVFGEKSLRDAIGVAAEKFDLDEGILLLEGVLERPHDLLNNQRRVERKLAFLLRAFDENFLPVSGFQ